MTADELLASVLFAALERDRVRGRQTSTRIAALQQLYMAATRARRVPWWLW